MIRVAILLALAFCACTPDIATDPQPAVMEFDPSAGRVTEPTFAVVNPVTRLIDLGLAGIEVPADCSVVGPALQAQCEFSQYLESLDGFPTSSTARTPASAVLDMATLTPQNVAAFNVVPAPASLASVVNIGFDTNARYLQVAPKRSWPVGSFVWVGVRGYQGGVRAVGGQEVVASTAYNFLKRDDSVVCKTEGVCTTANLAEVIPAMCPYLQLLTQQMSDAAARANLVQLESLRCALRGGVLQGTDAWSLLAGVGGIPKAEAVVFWGFPVHSAPVIELDPAVGAVPQVLPTGEIQLSVNGDLDPATVVAYRFGQNEGSVYLLNLGALMTNMIAGSFPPATASYAGGVLTVKSDAPLAPGTYAVVVTRDAKSPTGKALVPPPAVVLALARGPVVNAAGVSQVTSVSNAQAAVIEQSRLLLQQLLDNQLFVDLTRLRRETIAYVASFNWGAP
jgi:hypothetical protein